MNDRIKKVTIRVMPPNEKEQKRVWKSPAGELFAASGIQRILDAVEKWCAEKYPETKWAIVQVDIAEFHFMPERRVIESGEYARLQKTIPGEKKLIEVVPN